MTIDEKVQLVHGALTAYNPGPIGQGGWIPGVPRLSIPDLGFQDGSVGVASGVGQSTALPSSIASAASWDLDLAYQYGTVIGKEMRAHGVNVNLGGNTNLTGREPRDGRTFETKGEDPVLAGRIAAAHNRGIQDQHIIAGMKHYALNDQETNRFTANALIDERSMRESDLLAFEIGVKDSNAQSVMCSYNLVNSTYACENGHLLNGVLKGDWAFPGFVMSDWYATHSGVTAAVAGLDQEQPDGQFFVGGTAEGLKQAVQNGDMPAARLDNMVHRILRAIFAVGLYANPVSIGTIDVTGDATIAQTAEEQGAVLLKNAGQLPLDASLHQRIAVIGMHADVGVLSGGGSAQVMPIGGAIIQTPAPNPPGWGSVIWDPSSPLNAIQAKAPNSTVQFIDGSDPVAAATLARSCDVAIVFVAVWTSEGMDLTDLSLGGNQDALVSAVAAANPHTIVVVESGGAQVMPWLASVSAVLEAWFPGQQGAQAIANILFGDVNPSGKLPITFPASVADLPRPTIPAPADPNSTVPFNVDYTIEGLNVGYKWYDSKGLPVLFPFGFGLSYTTFSISNLTLTPNLAPATPGFAASFDVQNTGTRAGAEVAQVYVALPAGIGEPPVRLVGWQKVVLQPNQVQHVTVSVSASDSSHPLSYWDTTTNSWQYAAGNYAVYVGNSSRSTVLAGTFQPGPASHALAGVGATPATPATPARIGPPRGTGADPL
ncbi:MAG TPA: glycoside hydrolase family 3 C-terminal domain-containing protein [Bryobacteraceae bacterium]|nr:glycoside hydrolase family 3 C-terminal domain-containing protein [Bryobacteraceae bacterium]